MRRPAIERIVQHPRHECRHIEHKLSRNSATPALWMKPRAPAADAVGYAMSAAPYDARHARVALIAVIASGIVLDVVIGQLVRNVLRLPVFVDSIGTILAGALAGPLAGAAVGAVSNVIWGLMFGDPYIIPYAITAACIGAAAAAASALGAFKSLHTAILAGLITGIMAALVSAPITAYIDQTAGGPGQVALRDMLALTSANVFKAVTLQGFVSDPLDKAISFGVAFLIVQALPPHVHQRLAEARSLSRSKRLSARYGTAAVLSTVALIFAWVFRPAYGTNAYVAFYLVVVVSAWYGGLGPAILAGLVGLCVNLGLHVPPLGPGLDIDDWLRVSLYVSVAFLIALITDQRERTNSALADSLAEQREQEAQTLAVVNGVVEALVLVAPADHRLLSVNHQFEELFGVSEPQLVGRRMDDLDWLVERVFAEPDQFRARVASTAADAQARFTETLQQAWPQKRLLELFSTPILSDGHFLGRLYGFRDVTHERDLDRMKTEFVSQVSHELRTPLAAIKGFTEMVRDGDAGDVNEEQHEYLTVVDSNVDRLVALVNDLLDISRIESGRIELDVARIDLTTIIDSVVTTMRPLLDGKTQTLTLDLEPDLPLAMGDYDRMVQVITNLVSNAHKYTQAGGLIHVRAERAGDLLRVAVEDNGIGIPAEDVPKLFSRFFRVDTSLTREVGGTGLGLSIVKSIVELQGGTVSVDTELDRGSTFAFTLPVATSSKPKEAAPVAAAVLASQTILVVDSEPNIANQLESSLLRAGYHVRVAPDRMTAVAWLDEERPDLAMLRVCLSAPRGFDDARALSEAAEARDIPLLVVSIQREPTDAVSDVSTSPRVNEAHVVQHVQQALARSSTRRVLIIEDDAATRRLLSVGLRNRGFEPVEAADGETGMVAATEEPPDLVLLDLGLPGTDGFTVLHRLKRSPATAQIPVIVVTGDEELRLGARARVLALNAADSVGRPFDMDSLIDEIRALIPQT
jgi:signal transduction histidine kinase/DNA-binding response OmpR family regulator